MAAERDIQHNILLAIGSRPYLRLWRQNVGVAIPIGVVQSALKSLVRRAWNDATNTLLRARVVSFGQRGSADLTGALACGRRLELEVKKPGAKQTQDQRRFQSVCDSLNVLYAVVTSVESAEALLVSHLEECSVCARRTEWQQTASEPSTSP